MNIDLYQKKKDELHLTYDEIVKRSGLSKRTIAGFFSGDPKYANPSVATLKAIQEALELNSFAYEWTDDDKALGVGKHPEYYSEEEIEWMDLRSEIIEAHGKDQLNMVKTMLKAWTKQKK